MRNGIIVAVLMLVVIAVAQGTGCYYLLSRLPEIERAGSKR